MKNRKLLIFTTVVLFVLVISIVVVLIINHFEPEKLDILVRDFAYSIRGEKTSFFGRFIVFYTDAIAIYLVILLIIAMLIIDGFKKTSLYLAIGTGSNWVLNFLIKLCFMRERPDQALQWVFESSSSFPSGHSMTVAYFYTLFAFFTNRSNMKKIGKVSITCACIFFTATVAISRLILGVHYFTDVIAGLALGFAFSFITILIYTRKDIINRIKKNNIEKPCS